MVSSSKLVAALSFIAVNSASAFTTTAPIANDRTLRIQQQETTTQLDIFGKAFSNDDSLGKAANPGLKKVRFSAVIVV